MSRPALTFVLITALSAAPLLAADWPQFRGPDGNGLAAQAKLPVSWSADTNIRWKVVIPGAGWSSPVVWGNRIFLTTAETDKQAKPEGGQFDPGSMFAPFVSPKAPDAVYRLKVLCLDAADGKVLWETIAHEGKPRTPIHRNNTYASETPVTDGRRLIAYFGNTGLYCYDLAGKPLWNKDLGAYPTQMGWGTGSSPALHDGRVFLQCDNDKSSFLVALDATTGGEIWRAARQEKSNWSTPYLWKNKLRAELIASGGAKTQSFDPATGKLLWELKANGRSSVTPVGDAELLFVDSVDRLMGIRGSITAVRPGASGDISLPAGQTASDFVAWTLPLNLPRIASPILLSDCLLVLAQQNASATCLDAKTGKQLYSQRLPQAKGFTASPIAADGRIYCLDERGVTVILKPGPDFELIASNPLDGETFWASPAPLADALLLRGTDHLYCITQR